MDSSFVSSSPFESYSPDSMLAAEPSTEMSSTPTGLPTPTQAPSSPMPSSPSNPRQLRHHEIIILFILFTVVLFFVLLFLLLWKYNRSKLRYLYYRMKYFVCCCKLSEEDIQRQNDEDDTPVFNTLNDLFFGVNEHDEVARVNISALTEDGEDDDDIGDAVNTPLPMEVSVKSFFPDLLVGMDNKSGTNNNNDNSGNHQSREDDTHDNNLQQPLLMNDRPES